MKHVLIILSILFFGVTSIPYSFSQTSFIEKEYSKFAQNDEGEILLSSGMRLSFKVTVRRSRDTMEIIQASLEDPLRPELINYNGLVVTLDHSTKEINGFFDSGEGQFRLNTTGDGSYSWEKVEPPKILDRILKTSNKSSADEALAFDVRSKVLPFGETDNSGRFVIDVFIGFSDAAAAYVGNIQTTAASYVESVNMALLNSDVTSVYMRLVGVGTTPNNPGVTFVPLDEGKNWFRNEIQQYAPDIIGIVQMPTDAPNSAGGWAPVGGDINVIGAPWPSAFRHEVGHNVGGIHCDEDDGGYNFGYQTSSGAGTSQCGNNLAYYSTPLVRDDSGNIIGTNHSHDMARLWRERAAEMSANRTHTVPFPGEGSEPAGIVIQAEDYLSFVDSSAGNSGGAYRSDDVDIQGSSDIGGGYNVGWTSAGERLTYTVNIPESGVYAVSYRTASLNGQGVFAATINGVTNSLDVSGTSGWQNWITLEGSLISLPAGTYSLTIEISEGLFNLNWIEFTAQDIPPVGDFVRIQNKWFAEQHLNVQNGAIDSSAINQAWGSAQWEFEGIAGTDFVAIRNRSTGEHLHIEYGRLEAGPVDASAWWSAHWELEPVSGNEEYVRIKNRWQTDITINIEGNGVEASEVQPGWWSAWWRVIPAN